MQCRCSGPDFSDTSQLTWIPLTLGLHWRVDIAEGTSTQDTLRKKPSDLHAEGTRARLGKELPGLPGQSRVEHVPLSSWGGMCAILSVHRNCEEMEHAQWWKKCRDFSRLKRKSLLNMCIWTFFKGLLLANFGWIFSVDKRHSWDKGCPMANCKSLLQIMGALELLKVKDTRFFFQLQSIVVSSNLVLRNSRTVLAETLKNQPCGKHLAWKTSVLKFSLSELQLKQSLILENVGHP